MKNLIKKNQLMISALAIMIAIAGYLQFAGDNLEEELGGEDEFSVADNVTVDEDGIEDVSDTTGVISENYTAEGISEAESVDGLLDLSDEDLLSEQQTEIASLDSDVDVVVDDYLDEDMEVAQAGTETTDAGNQVAEAENAETSDNQVAEVTPEEGEVPGEAVFTSTAGVNVLSEAKLLKEQTRAKNKETLMEIVNSAGLTDEQKQDAVNSMVQMTEYAEQEAAAEILLEAKGFSDVVVSVSSDGVDVVVNAEDLSDAQRAQIEDIVTRKTEVAAEDIVISTVAQ